MKKENKKGLVFQKTREIKKGNFFSQKKEREKGKHAKTCIFCLKKNLQKSGKTRNAEVPKCVFERENKRKRRKTHVVETRKTRSEKKEKQMKKWMNKRVT